MFYIHSMHAMAVFYSFVYPWLYIHTAVHQLWRARLAVSINHVIIIMILGKKALSVCTTCIILITK